MRTSFWVYACASLSCACFCGKISCGEMGCWGRALYMVAAALVISQPFLGPVLFKHPWSLSAVKPGCLQLPLSIWCARQQMYACA